MLAMLQITSFLDTYNKSDAFEEQSASQNNDQGFDSVAHRPDLNTLLLVLTRRAVTGLHCSFACMAGACAHVYMRYVCTL